MKILKNKKSLASIAAILVALALIAGSTMAWFVLKGDVAGAVDVGNIDFEMKLFNLPRVADVAAPVDGQQAMDANGKIVAYDLATATWAPVLYQPGYYVPSNFGLLDYDNSFFDSEYYADPLNAGLWEDDLGYIKNTGNLPIVISLGGPDPVTVERKYAANLVDTDGDGVADAPQWPCTQFLPNNAVVDASKKMLLATAPADIAGVPGAVLVKLAIPPTPNNIRVLTQDVTATLGDPNQPDPAVGKYYLSLSPGATLDVVCIIDLKTNAGYNVLNDTDPAVSAKYLDNTYMDCEVKLNPDGWLVTQYDPTDAYIDVFGLTPNPGNGDLIDFGPTPDNAVPGYLDWWINPALSLPVEAIVLDLN